MYRKTLLFASALSICNGFAPNVFQSQKTITKINPFIKDIKAPTPTEKECLSLNAMLEQTELPEKLYFKKETPKVLGGIKIGLRKLVVVTGASSGLGLKCAATLAKTGRYFVVMACRDVEKGKRGE